MNLDHSLYDIVLRNLSAVISFGLFLPIQNRQLKQEQVILMDELMKASKELDRRDTQVTKDEVIAQMKDNWAMRARNAQTLEG